MDEMTVICGYKDGRIICWDLSNPTAIAKWEIANAHRESVLSIAVMPAIFASGGKDGILRIWNSKSHSIIANFCPVIGFVIFQKFLFLHFFVFCSFFFGMLLVV